MYLYDKIKASLKEKGIFNITISGSTCSGKTTLSNSIKEDFSKEYSITIVKQDDYYKNLTDIPRGDGYILLDSPDAFHTKEFVQDIKELFTTFRATIPRYDVSTNRRIAKDREIKLGQINIFEGLHTTRFLKGFTGFYHVFLDTNLQTCLERRINRDTNLYGVNPRKVFEFFQYCILPMYKNYILPQKDEADLIIKDNSLRGEVYDS